MSGSQITTNPRSGSVYVSPGRGGGGGGRQGSVIDGNVRTNRHGSVQVGGPGAAGGYAAGGVSPAANVRTNRHGSVQVNPRGGGGDYAAAPSYSSAAPAAPAQSQVQVNRHGSVQINGGERSTQDLGRQIRQLRAAEQQQPAASGDGGSQPNVHINRTGEIYIPSQAKVEAPTPTDYSGVPSSMRSGPSPIKQSLAKFNEDNARVHQQRDALLAEARADADKAQQMCRQYSQQLDDLQQRNRALQEMLEAEQLKVKQLSAQQIEDQALIEQMKRQWLEERQTLMRERDQALAANAANSLHAPWCMPIFS